MACWSHLWTQHHLVAVPVSCFMQTAGRQQVVRRAYRSSPNSQQTTSGGPLARLCQPLPTPVAKPSKAQLVGYIPIMPQPSKAQVCACPKVAHRQGCSTVSLPQTYVLPHWCVDRCLEWVRSGCDFMLLSSKHSAVGLMQMLVLHACTADTGGSVDNTVCQASTGGLEVNHPGVGHRTIYILCQSHKSHT